MGIILERFPFLKTLVLIIPGLVTGIVVEYKFTLIAISFITLLACISLILKKREVVYLSFAFGSGLLASLYFLPYKEVIPTNKFTSLESTLFGTITNVYSCDSNFARLRIEGNLYLFSKKYTQACVLLSIMSNNGNLPRFSEGDLLLCFVNVRPPRGPSLPTDIDEPRIARLEEVQLFGKTSTKRIIRHWENPTRFYSSQINLKNYLKQKIEQIFSQRNVGIFLAVLLGDRSQLRTETRIKFSTTGISHILALSGFHIGIIIAIAVFLLDFLKNKWARLCSITIFLVIYLIAIGSPPSAIRASIMVLAYLYSRNIERKTNLLNLLAFILICILLFEPSMLFSIGFQLSFLAVLSIALFGGKTELLLHKLIPSNNEIIRFFRSLFAVTISAQILTAPVVAYYFGYYTFISFFANIVVIPLFILAIVYGFTSIIVSLFSISLAKAIGSTADWLIYAADIINDWLANQFSSLVIRNNELLLFSVLVALVLLLLIYSSSRINFLFRFAIGVFVILILVHQYRKIPPPPIQFYPREKYVAILATDSRRVVCLLLDRKPHLRPTRDIAMERYLSSLEGDLKIGVSGNVGIAIADEIRQQRKMDVFEASANLQRTYSRLLFQKKNFFKITENIEWK